MYINLPSKNNYRRPASYASKGYRTRRMAVDFAIPLITNVKNAKLLAEALVRKLPLDVSSIDSKCSYLTHTFPGLVNISAFLPRLTSPKADDFEQATRASISAGFTTSLVLPVGLNSAITSASLLEQVHATAAGSARCNYALSIAGKDSNVQALSEEVRADVKSLYISFHGNFAPPQISTVAAYFASWPQNKTIVTDARGSNLASVLLLASLHNRSVHITDVRNKDDLLLISLSKEKHLKVTCDVSVFALFFTQEQYSQPTSLPSAQDQEALWKNLDVIDAFSVGMLPYQLATELQESASAWSGAEETLPLLLTAVTSGRLTLEDIRVRLHDNPIRIFGLPEQATNHVEVVLGRRAQHQNHSTCWSPLQKSSVTGTLHRVVVHGKTLFLDGELSVLPLGKDVSSATIVHAAGERQAGAPPAKPQLPSAARVPDGSVPPHQQTALAPSASGPAGPSINVPPVVVHGRHPAFHRRHILSVKQFTQRDMYDLFSLAHEMQLQVERNGTLDILKGKVLCTLFYEPSTRTSTSFDAAMKRCGGEVIQVNVDTSSVKKGETLADTVRTLGSYADAIVIRHPDVGSAQLAAKYSPVPVLNAGDGIGEHPSQVRAQSMEQFEF
jgi:carbamoyl-phosphate synthase/aspartate carbamoyltransferase